MTFEPVAFGGGEDSRAIHVTADFFAVIFRSVRPRRHDMPVLHNSAMEELFDRTALGTQVTITL